MYIPGYRIEREVGQGGMATVYLATQEIIERPVALKVISSNLAADKSFTKRFLKEGRIVAQLSHPKIVTLYDIGAYENSYYFSMEYLPAGTLRQKIEQGITLQRTLGIVKTIADALGYAHRRGFVHRDIKPGNILFRENGTPVLTDFGIAKALSTTTIMTLPGSVLGSPKYMSPEQARGKPIDSRSDIYSLGVLFYEMLTGRPLFDAQDPFAAALKHISEPVPLLPPELAIFQPVLNRLLAKNPDERFATAEDFIRALKQAESGQWPQLSSDSVKTVIELPEQPAATDERVRSSRAWKLMVSLVVMLGLIGVGIFSLYSPIMPHEEGRARYYRERAKVLLDNGEVDESMREVYKGLAELPNDAGLLALRASVETRLTATADVQQELRKQKKIITLLAHAGEQLEKGWLLEPPEDSALAVYQKVLALEPDNAEAKAGLEWIAAQFQQQAEQHFRSGELEDSLAVIEKVLAAFSEDVGLMALREKVQAVLEKKRIEAQRELAVKQQRIREISRLLAEASEHMQRLRLTQPRGDNAYESYNRILELDPQNAEALAGLQRIPSAYFELAKDAKQSGQIQRGLTYIERGLDVMPGHAELLQLREELRSQLQKPKPRTPALVEKTPVQKKEERGWQFELPSPREDLPSAPVVVPAPEPERPSESEENKRPIRPFGIF